VEKWQKFLDSIATKGGNLLILAVFVMFFFVSLFVMWMLKLDTGQSQVVTVITATFSGFSGALLTALTGRQPDQRKTDTGTAAPPPPPPIAPAPAINRGAGHP
jgi:hypothetical protein